MVNQAQKEKLKNAVRYLYDLQELRIQSTGRAAKKAEAAEAYLDDDDKQFLASTGKELLTLEKSAKKEVSRLLKGIPIYEHFLKDVRGIGDALAGILISEINIENCNTVSQLWAWCGLSVIDGHAQRRVKGVKGNYNPWLKAKLLKVMGDCLVKAASLDEAGYHTKAQVYEDGARVKVDDPDNPGEQMVKMRRVEWTGRPPYRKFYDDYKNRKENQLVEVCMGCQGTGMANVEDEEAELQPCEKKPTKKVPCRNCNGTGKNAPWGASKAHRAAAANRYMVKMFLLDFWKEWRTLEGLDVRVPYAEEYLHRQHHAA